MALLKQLIKSIKTPRAQGADFELLARQYLEAQGLCFIAGNQSFKCGEIDLIMQDGATIVFIEVRQRKSANFGSALESIDWRKQQKWQKAANLWLAQRNQSLDTADCRFDVVVFEGDQTPHWIANFLG